MSDAIKPAFTATLSHDATPEEVQAFRDAYELGAAWAEAEAALPEGWDVHLWGDHEAGWSAQSCDDYGLRALATGPTPAAALRALAAELKEAARDE